MPEIHEPVIILKPDAIHFAETARVDSFCKLEGGGGIHLGEYVHIASFCHLNIGGGVLVMHDQSAMGSGAKVITGSNMIDAESCSAVVPADKQRIERWSVHIGKNATLFANAIAMSDLGEGAILAANAFLPRNTPIPAYEIWGGTPARKIGTRNAKPNPAAKIKWNEYFSWHCQVHRCRPEVRPMVDTELVQDAKPENGMVQVWGQTFDKKDKAIAVPVEFVEVIS